MCRDINFYIIKFISRNYFRVNIYVINVKIYNVNKIFLININKNHYIFNNFYLKIIIKIVENINYYK